MARVILPVLTIAAVAIAAGMGGVLAYFTSVGQSEGNVFASGSLVLEISDDNEGPIHGVVSESFGGVDFVPGEVFTGWVKLWSTGTIGGEHVDITLSNEVTEATSLPGSEANTSAASALEVQSLWYDADGDGTAETDLLVSPPPDANANGIVDLEDLEGWDQEDDEDLVDLPLTDLNIAHVLDLVIRFHPGLGRNEHQGDSVVVTLTLTLNQDSSQ